MVVTRFVSIHIDTLSSDCVCEGALICICGRFPLHLKRRSTEDDQMEIGGSYIQSDSNIVTSAFGFQCWTIYCAWLHIKYNTNVTLCMYSHHMQFVWSGILPFSYCKLVNICICVYIYALITYAVTVHVQSVTSRDCSLLTWCMPQSTANSATQCKQSGKHDNNQRHQRHM